MTAGRSSGISLVAWPSASWTRRRPAWRWGRLSPAWDRLTGAGDAYTITTQVHRVQVALVERGDLARLPRTDPILEDFPEVEAEDLGQEVEARWAYTGAELACGLAAAARGWGRPRLVELLAARGLGRPGAERAIRLLQLGREALEALDALGLEVVERPAWRASCPPEAGAIVDLERYG